MTFRCVAGHGEIGSGFWYTPIDFLRFFIILMTNILPFTINTCNRITQLRMHPLFVPGRRVTSQNKIIVIVSGRKNLHDFTSCKNQGTLPMPCCYHGPQCFFTVIYTRVPAPPTNFIFHLVRHPNGASPARHNRTVTCKKKQERECMQYK